MYIIFSSYLHLVNGLWTSQCQVPEIRRVPLEELVLQIHVMGLDPAIQFLGQVPEPPAESAVKAAITSLQVCSGMRVDLQLAMKGTE